MKFPTLFIAGVLLVGSAHAASAQVPIVRTQNVSVTVTAVDVFDVLGGPVSLSVGIGTTTDAATATYTVQTNSNTARSITAQITAGTAFPTGVTVTADFQQPAGGTSPGAVPLTTTATPVVTNITHAESQTLSITYAATATAAAISWSTAARRSRWARARPAGD